MKKLFQILFLIALPVLAQSAPQGLVTVAWDYPASELVSNLTFKLYGSASVSVPLTNWVVLTNVVGTSTTARIQIPGGAGAYFLSCTASNQWGESPFSNVLPVPALPRITANFRIQLLQ